MMRNENMNPKELKFPQGAGHEKCREVFAAQAGKARVYKDNGFTVEVSFAGSATLESCIAEYLSRKYGIPAPDSR